MAAPPLDQACALQAAPHPLASLLATGGSKTLDTSKVLALVKQALQLYKSSPAWPQSKTVHAAHDSVIKVTKGKPAQQQQPAPQPRLAKCAWHARDSVHDPATQSHKMGYHDFHEGLAVDHPVKEIQYIHDMLRYEKVGGEAAGIQPPVLSRSQASKSISAIGANVWISEYTTPFITANRDFCELFITVEFAPHSDPLSPAHIDEIVANIEKGSAGGGTATEAVGQQTPASAGGRSSCINIQLPVATDACPPQSSFVRAFYASVEMVRELEGDKTEWWMAVQSDTAGQLPLTFQEMAMPSKIAPDVPLFIGWAIEQKQKDHQAQ